MHNKAPKKHGITANEVKEELISITISNRDESTSDNPKIVAATHALLCAFGTTGSMLINKDTVRGQLLDNNICSSLKFNDKGGLISVAQNHLQFGWHDKKMKLSLPASYTNYFCMLSDEEVKQKISEYEKLKNIETNVRMSIKQQSQMKEAFSLAVAVISQEYGAYVKTYNQVKAVSTSTAARLSA